MSAPFFGEGEVEALRSELDAESDERLLEHLGFARGLGLLLCQRIYGGSSREKLIEAIVEAEQERWA